MYHLTEQTIQAPEGLSCRFLLPEIAQTSQMVILVVSVEGDYPDGSLGNPYGAYIAVSGLLGLHYFDPDCIIYDFSGMTYRWGNTLLRAFGEISEIRDAEMEEGEPPFPVLAVTSEKCRDAFLSLMAAVNNPEPAWHFTNLNEAITRGTTLAGEWLDA